MEDDGRLAAQLGAGHLGEGTGAHPVGGHARHGLDDDGELLGGQAGCVGRQIPLQPLQFARQQPGEAVARGGGPSPRGRTGRRPARVHVGTVAGDLHTGQGRAGPPVAQTGGRHLGGEQLQGPVPLRGGARLVPPVRHEGPGRQRLQGPHRGGRRGRRGARGRWGPSVRRWTRRPPWGRRRNCAGSGRVRGVVGGGRGDRLRCGRSRGDALLGALLDGLRFRRGGALRGTGPGGRGAAWWPVSGTSRCPGRGGRRRSGARPGRTGERAAVRAGRPGGARRRALARGRVGVALRQAAVDPDSAAGALGELAGQLQVAVARRRHGQHDRGVLGQRVAGQVGGDQLGELVGVQLPGGAVRQLGRHPVVAAVRQHRVRGRVPRPRRHVRVPGGGGCARGAGGEPVHEEGVELGGRGAGPVQARHPVAAGRHVPGAVVREQAMLLQVEGGERGQTGGPAGGDGPAGQRVQVAPHLRVDEHGRRQVPDPAGDGVHVQGPGAQGRVGAPQRVQGVQGGGVTR
ncbi:hypothetical protein SMICM17S_13062 [Streptomyces microflavus]